MKTSIKKVAEKYAAACSSLYTRTTDFINRHGNMFLLVAGTAILTVGLSQVAAAQVNWNDESIIEALSRIFLLIEGSFGALVMVVSGLAAIISAAMGAYRAALGCLVVAVGAFILRAMVSLFFDQVMENVDEANI